MAFEPCAFLLAAALAAPPSGGPADAGTQASRADGPLTRAAAEAAVGDSFRAAAARTRAERAAELDAGSVSAGGATMRVWLSKPFGEVPEGKRPVWISLHGGGQAPHDVNDQQWRNQQRLYRPPAGIYVAPRAPTDDWNLWHQAPVDALLARLIEDLVVCRGADPDRVYLLGYSAGGDGVYQLAPRMADRFAAASMMAGHPNDARPDGLRNLPFAIHVGALDGAFDRNKVAAQWGSRLDELAKADPGAYVHVVEVHGGKGHWMDLEDASALPWMAKFVRDARPRRVVWVQDDVTHTACYWLAVDRPVAGQRIVAERDGQEIRVLEAPPGTALRIRLDDRMLDLDRPVRVTQGGKALFEGIVPRSRRVVDECIAERCDPRCAFTAEVAVTTCTPPAG